MDLRTRVLEELQWSPLPLSVEQLSHLLETSSPSVRSAVAKLLDEGKVEQYTGTNAIQLVGG